MRYVTKFMPRHRCLCGGTITRNQSCSSVRALRGLEQSNLENINNCSNPNIYSYLETSGGKSYILYLNVVHFFNAIVN
jgi:hypothetical protein